MSTASPIYHRPALVQEVMDVLAIGPGHRCVDATVGDGGHSMALLNASKPDGLVLGIDADPQSLERTRTRLYSFADRLTLVEDNFSNLESVVERYHFRPISAILVDLGLSSWQLEGSGRGFSFQEDVPLDMRLSPNQLVTASQVVNNFPVHKLNSLIATYGEEPRARRIARSIAAHRPIRTALELARSVEAAIPRRGRRLHPATRTFQAIRIFVNRDLETLESILWQAVRILGQGGRMAIIAYHSLEDRLVKRFMRQEARDCHCPPAQPQCTCDHRASIRILTKKVSRPSRKEVLGNPRVRSARLRACVRLENQEEISDRVRGVVTIEKVPSA